MKTIKQVNTVAIIFFAVLSLVFVTIAGHYQQKAIDLKSKMNFYEAIIRSIPAHETNETKYSVLRRLYDADCSNTRKGKE